MSAVFNIKLTSLWDSVGMEVHECPSESLVLNSSKWCLNAARDQGFTLWCKLREKRTCARRTRVNTSVNVALIVQLCESTREEKSETCVKLMEQKVAQIHTTHVGS